MNPLTTFPCSKAAYGSELPVGEVTTWGRGAGGVNTGPGVGEGRRVKILPLLLCKAGICSQYENRYAIYPWH